MKSVTTSGRRAGGGHPAIARLACALAMLLALGSGGSLGGQRAPAAKPAPAKPATRPASRPARKNLKLPGLVVNFQERCVDIVGSVCLEEGLLELIACTKGTKEHESIVAIQARPMHIHAALLVLGAKAGNPAMRKPLDEEGTRWIHIPPRGDPVDVYLVFKGKEGKTVERPISDFVARARRADQNAGADGRNDDDDITFPHTFLFAGSQLRGNGPGPRTYLCDRSGHVITISTFGDDLLCLPGIHGREDGLLMWEVDPTHLPKLGSKVTLRLRPQARSAPKAGKAKPGSTTKPALKQNRQQ